MGSTARCPSHSRPRLASKPFPPPPRPQSNIYRPGERIWPSLAGSWLGARRACQPLHPPSLGSWQWRAFSFVSSRLSPSVALLPMPKREREGGPGRKKSVFPNNSLSLTHTHTHTHTHTLSHPTSCLFPSHSWHNKPLNQIGKRHCHPPPLHTTPEPVPGSLGIASTHPPPAGSPCLFGAPTKGRPASSKSLPGEQWHNLSSWLLEALWALAWPLPPPLHVPRLEED